MSNTYKILDNHVHVVGKGDVYPEDLYWSRKFEKGVGFWALKVLKGWGFKKVGDKLIEENLIKQANKMKYVDYAVVLAFDNVYDVDGTYRGPKQDKKEDIYSTIYVSNRYVDELCQNNPNLLLGISVHPFRDDAIEELETYKERAVLCKWMASAQFIDFDNPLAKAKLEKFYKKLAELKLPLLIHTGVETSIPASKEGYDKFNDPRYMRDALNMGVTVILAHCGCSYFDILLKQDNFVKEAINLFKEQETEHPEWKLYGDISALFSPFRKRKILKEVFENIPASKLIYGSDYPNPAKGIKESIIRVFLRYGKRNLIKRYYKISKKWLKKYYSQEESELIFTNFHRLLEELERGDIIK
jgi:predicted TIM-barrel fold metal-dependent hydrolase